MPTAASARRAARSTSKQGAAALTLLTCTWQPAAGGPPCTICGAGPACAASAAGWSSREEGRAGSTAGQGQQFRRKRVGRIAGGAASYPSLGHGAKLRAVCGLLGSRQMVKAARVRERGHLQRCGADGLIQRRAVGAGRQPLQRPARSCSGCQLRCPQPPQAADAPAQHPGELLLGRIMLASTLSGPDGSLAPPAMAMAMARAGGATGVRCWGRTGGNNGKFDSQGWRRTAGMTMEKAGCECLRMRMPPYYAVCHGGAAFF
jgi:hypothetical protein